MGYGYNLSVSIHNEIGKLGNNTAEVCASCMPICYTLRAGTVRHLKLPLRPEFRIIRGPAKDRPRRNSNHILYLCKKGLVYLHCMLHCKFECEAIASINLIIYNSTVVLKIEIKGSGSICIKGFNKIIPRVGYA